MKSYPIFFLFLNLFYTAPLTAGAPEPSFEVDECAADSLQNVLILQHLHKDKRLLFIRGMEVVVWEKGIKKGIKGRITAISEQSISVGERSISIDQIHKIKKRRLRTTVSLVVMCTLLGGPVAFIYLYRAFTFLFPLFNPVIFLAFFSLGALGLAFLLLPYYYNPAKQLGKTYTAYVVALSEEELNAMLK